MSGKVGGYGDIAEDAFTRPADTTQYADGDAMSDSTSAPTVLEFVVARLNGDCGFVRSAYLASSANPTTKLQSELLLFDTEPTGQEDNLPLDLTDAEVNRYLGKVVLDLAEVNPTAGAGGNSAGEAGDQGLFFKTLKDSRSIYGILVADNAYTPVSGEVFTIRLAVEQC